jgi:hypothetical protein
MNNHISIKPTGEKDYYDIRVNGVSFGTWERSDIRHLITELDNAI